MGSTPRRVGPSPEAIERNRRMLLALLDAGGSLTRREIKARTLMEDGRPISANDLSSCLRRSYGAGWTRRAGDCKPWRFELTGSGYRAAVSLVNGLNEWGEPDHA